MLLLTAFAAHPAGAETDLERGKLLAYTCQGCHGIERYRNAYPSFHVPKLGGQSGDYIATALKAYRGGNREHGTMQAQGESLSDQDIADIAAYLGSFEQAKDALSADDVAGIDAAALCITCHGDQGAAIVPTPPTLSGQHEDYLVHALEQYRSGERGGNVMAAFAAGLSDADIRMLARLYATQEGLYTLSD